MFNESSKDWARDKPKLLSDWTARPFLIQWCSPIADKKILDLGCGEGYFTRRLIRSSDESPKHVEGLDISSEMIELAKINEDQRPRGISYSVGCATDFSAQLSNYDLITAVFVYNYTTVEEMHQSMKRVHDHMEVGGHFVFSLPHPVNPFIESGLDSFYFERSGGWFSGRDQTFEGKMAQRDGSEVSVRCLHKTFEDVLDGLRNAGFVHFPEFRELGVTDKLYAKDPDFFGPLVDIPLHVAFKVRK